MGYVSNQWINTGSGIRYRKYNPVEATILPQVPDDDGWSLSRGLVFELRATRANGEYQTLLLTQTELEAAIQSAAPLMSGDERMKLMVALLSSLTSGEFVSVLRCALNQFAHVHAESTNSV